MINFKKYLEEGRYSNYDIVEKEGEGLAGKSKKSGISVDTLKKVYNRGVAAWKTGHRPGN
jgi:lambda repressor-like predicted transcriptional regulator